ncbi:hypothetical protein DAETH_17430 [Deinococcus aetherius]|uniref:Uncharacterized protein n=1 Tax=Deinococcus aetherius TaxID=200252 RepID=A0ABN6RIT1_9DEIO|nr:hypothetical protein DAETH_17430 [Deinococcus aetherius]
MTVAPPTEPDHSDVNWYHVETLYSPGHRAAAVRFCWEVPKFMGCAVRLARPDGSVLDLENSDVLGLLWTTDGKYLLGASHNTLRLWNPVGGVRTVTPGTEIDGDPPLRLGVRSVCVRTGGEVTRYALPSLKLLGRQTVFSDNWTCR